MAASDPDEGAIFNIARQVKDLVARQLYLRQACGEDEVLRRRIEALLRVHEEERGFLASPTEELHALLGASVDVGPDTPIGPDKLLEKIGLNDPTSDIAFAPADALGEIGRLGGYRILKRLGAGGMGIVYQAEDVQLQRPIALKVMKAEAAQNPGSRQRFLREARAVAKLRSDHVVHIYQVGEERQIVFLAMEFLEGMSLADWLNEGGKPTMAQAARIGRQIALGLADAHASGLIHRDIKPGNIWLDSRSEDRVKLLDFGLARPDTEQTQLTQPGAILGTPEYMAPEQARADKVDSRCDLFSLGVVLYRLTTGRMPFRGANTMAILTALAVDTPPPPCQVNPAIPPRLSTLIERLLAKDREKRPATAKAVAEELALIEGEATVGASTVSASAIVSTRTRSRLRWPVAASLLLGLGTSTVILFVCSKTPDGQVQERPVPPGAKAEIVAKDEPLPPPGGLADLDALEAAKIPEEERIPGLPRETVAVLGSHRGWHREGNGAKGAFLAYSPDGRRIATALGRGMGIHLWDARDLRLMGRIALSDDLVTGLAFAPDGKSLAVATGEEHARIRFWDVSGDEPTERLPALQHKEPVHGFAYSPDGKLLACVAGNQPVVRLWDLTATPPKVRAKLPDAYKGSPPTFAPDGKLLVYGDGQTGLRLWDVSTNPPRKATEFRANGAFFRSAFSSDGKVLAAADAASTVWLFDWNGAELIKRAMCPSPSWQGHPVSSLVFAAQGKRIAFSCMNYCPRLVDWSGLQLRDIDCSDCGAEPFNPLAFSPDGQTLAVFSCDYDEGNLQLWDVTGPKLRERSGRPGHITSVETLAFSRDGKLLVSGGERTVRLWRPIRGRFEQLALLEHPGAIHKLALSPDGKALAVAGKDTLRLWDLSARNPQERVTRSGEMRALAFSPDGKTLAWSNRADVHLGDLSKSKAAEKTVLKGHQKRVEALAFSPDGQTLASGGHDNIVRLWDVTQKEPRTRTVIQLPITPHPDEQVVDLAFLPDGKRLLVQRRWTGQVWDAALPKPQMKWEFTCSGGELCMTPARDGQSIFAVGAGTTRELLQRWFSPGDMRPWWAPGGHRSIAMATDGRHLALGNANGTIYVLRMTPLATAYPPLEDAWVRETASLASPDQIEAVIRKLQERNPDFDGQMKCEIENGELAGVDLSSKRVFDLAPLQALRPRRLYLFGTYSVVNLSPLRGMPLEELYLGQNSISDFTSLRDLPLRKLRFDLSFEPEQLAPLRSIKTLQSINDKPVVEFWKAVDAGKKP